MNGSDDKINEALIESELFQERRQFHRVQINDPIQLYYDSDSYDEVLGELSLQGVRVHSFFDYAIGSAVDIGVSRPDKSILRLKGIVTRCNMTPHSQRAYKDSAREFTCNQCKWRVYRCFAANGGLKVISVSAPANLEFGIPEDTSSPRCPTCHVDMNSIIPTSGYELGVFFGEITIEEVSVINDIIAANIDQVVDGGDASRRLRGRFSGQFLQESLECVFEDASSLYEGEVENLSLDGFSVVSDVDLIVGQLVTSSLGFKSQNRRFKSDVRILRKISRENDSGRYGYAVQFTFCEDYFLDELTRFLHSIRTRDFDRFLERHRQLTGQSGSIKFLAPALALGIVALVTVLISLLI